MYIGIIAEWNPFHTGHAHMLATLQQQYESPIVCAMSGAFVQRGEPALFDKWSRAAWAVQHGASAVFELPAACVLQSADRFAAAGVRLVFDLGCTHIAFGAETLHADEIEHMAAYTFTSEFHNRFRQCLDAGFPYAASIHHALEDRFPSLAGDVALPNNLLGIQYARAIQEQGLPLKIIVIPRMQKPPVSATRIRQCIQSGLRPPYIPARTQDAVRALLAKGTFTDYRRYQDACLLFLRLLSKDRLVQSGLFSEGLENKYERERYRSTYGAILDAVKSKRYLYSRLRRIGASLLLSPTGARSPMAAPQSAPYARLLALRRDDSGLVRQSRLPVITSVAKAMRTLPDAARKLLLLDISACDVQYYCFYSENDRAGRQDYYRSPIIC